MKMIFLGDICSIQKTLNLEGWERISTDSNIIIGNLEGAISEISRQDIVYNTDAIFEFFERSRINAVNLANNHVFDDEGLFDSTVQMLAKNRIKHFGAGKTISHAGKGLVFRQKDLCVYVFSFGWNVIGCKEATKTKCGVNPLEVKNLFETVKGVREKDSRGVVIFMFHWNFELEVFPQPMYRQMAKDLIDAGVDIVVGGHPHVAQGAELYKNKPIVYSLGNWFFPPRKLGNLDLHYPEIANLQLALEVNFSSRENVDAKFHWFLFRPDECDIVYKNTENFDGKTLKALTPFENMAHEDYCSWFKLNRRKSFLLPVYRDYKQTYRNYLKDILVVLRQKVIGLLLNLQLKAPPS